MCTHVRIRKPSRFSMTLPKTKQTTSETLFIELKRGYILFIQSCLQHNQIFHTIAVMLSSIRWIELSIRNIMQSKHRTYAILSYSNIWYLQSCASNSTCFKMFLNAQHLILYKVMRIHFRGTNCLRTFLRYFVGEIWSMSDFVS